MFDTAPELDELFPPDLVVNRQHELLRGQQAWWIALPNLVGGRTFYDLIGGLHNCTLNSFGTGFGWQPEIRQGGWGQVSFDGSSSHLDAATSSSAFVTSSPFSLCFAIKGPAVTSPGGNAVFAKGQISGISTNGMYMARDGTNNELHLFYGSQISGTLSAPVFDNAWHHCVLTYDGTTVAFFLDGKQTSTIAIGALASTSGFSLSFGQVTGGSAPNYNGSLDDIAFYSRNLSPAEIRERYFLARNFYPGVLQRFSSGFNLPALPPVGKNSQLSWNDRVLLARAAQVVFNALVNGGAHNDLNIVFNTYDLHSAWATNIFALDNTLPAT